jgi:hypothetical protein
VDSLATVLAAVLVDSTKGPRRTRLFPGDLRSPQSQSDDDALHVRRSTLFFLSFVIYTRADCLLYARPAVLGVAAWLTGTCSDNPGGCCLQCSEEQPDIIHV